VSHRWIQHYQHLAPKGDRSLRAAGHRGVPAIVLEGEPFFGQDRFDVLMWRLSRRS